MAEQYNTAPASYHEKEYSTTLEKGHPADHDVDYVVPGVNEADVHHFDEVGRDRVQRRLQQRHIQMIAIAGTIGTGLFLGSGHALARAGPLGALIAYIFMGSIAYSSLCSVAEMTCFNPSSGSFTHFASRWLDPSAGFATGWNYFYTQAMSIPVEVSAAQIILTFWDDNHNHGTGYLVLICFAVIAINLFGVRWFGESEFVFSIIKLCLITGLIIAGLVIDLGGTPRHDRIGFRYWKHPGAMNTYLKPGALGRFLAVIGVLVQAGFSYQGMELVAIGAAETVNPRHNIKKAVGRVFWRIAIFYILGILITGMIVPYNNEDLLSSTGTAAQSPYVIAMQSAGIKVLPHIINAGVFTSAFSAGNSFLYTASRTLYGLALRGQAPSVFAKCTKNGLPLYAVLISSIFPFLAFLTVSEGANTVFNWFVNLSTVGGFFAWLAINMTYINFWRGLRAQGIDRKQLIYYSPLQPWLAIWGTFWLIIIILINGYDGFFDFTAAGFLTCYLNIPLIFGFYIIHKIVRKTKVWKPLEMDFVTGIPTVEETEHEVPKPIGIWAIIAEKLF